MKKIDVKTVSLFICCLVLAAIQACSSAPAPATENAATATAPKDSATVSAAPVPPSPASDVPAIIKHTNKAVYLNDNQIASLTPDKMEIIDCDKNKIEPKAEILPWEPVALSKMGYKHYMFEILGSMLRRGGGGGISPTVLEDSLEFISAGVGSSAGIWTASFDIDCLTKDFVSVLDLTKKVLLAPAFDKDQLEIVKTKSATSYEQRYDTPAKVLSALRAKVNYARNNRLWDATGDEYKKVTEADLKRLARGVFQSKRIIFALSGDVDRDSSVQMLKEFFADWKKDTSTVSSKPADSAFVAPQPLAYLRKPGTYVVDKDISQANIAINQPFVKRPHPDYYPAAVASFILGGGSFTSRLMNRVRSDEGLAYSIYSTVGNDYRDTAMTTIALQTKVESVDFALKLIFEEVEKLAKEGPTAEELEQAKKALIESLPSLFDSPSATATIFAKGELLGKTYDHYLDYVKEVNAVTADQVKTMIAKYFARDKMTISIVGPVSKFDALKPFTVIPQDSLDFR